MCWCVPCLNIHIYYNYMHMFGGVFIGRNVACYFVYRSSLTMLAAPTLPAYLTSAPLAGSITLNTGAWLALPSILFTVSFIIDLIHNIPLSSAQTISYIGCCIKTRINCRTQWFFYCYLFLVYFMFCRCSGAFDSSWSIKLYLHMTRFHLTLWNYLFLVIINQKRSWNRET